MDATFINDTPGEVVARFRNKAGLTLHELGDAAKVPFSYVWAIEQGKRQVGQKVAKRLAAALKMSHKQQAEFILLVAQRAKRQTITDEALEVPQALLNAVAAWIAPRLEGREIESCFASTEALALPAEVRQRLNASPARDLRPDLAIKTADGQWLLFETKFVAI